MIFLLKRTYFLSAALAVFAIYLSAQTANQAHASGLDKDACGSGLVIYNQYKDEIIACQCNHKLFFRSREVPLAVSQRLNPCFHANGKASNSPAAESTPAPSSLQFSKEIRKELQKYQELTFSFEPDTATPSDRKDSKTQIRDLAKFMAQHSELKVRIIGVEGSTTQDVVADGINYLATQPGTHKDEFFKLFNLYGGQSSRQESTSVIGQLMTILEESGSLTHEQERVRQVSLTRAGYVVKELNSQNISSEQILAAEAAEPGQYLKLKRKDHENTIGQIAQVHQWVAENERVVVLFYDLDGNPVRP